MFSFRSSDSFVRLDSREERIDILTFASPFFFPLIEKKNAAEEPVLRNFNRETIIPLLPPSFTLFVAHRREENLIKMRATIIRSRSGKLSRN